MNSRLYVGTLTHRREHPVEHAFVYRHVLYGLDLDELPELDRGMRLFGHNRFRPAALHDRDHLGRGPGGLRGKLTRFLAPGPEPERVVLVTAPRYFHYVFNPVSFFFCRGPAGAPDRVVAEVSNTVGDTHLYRLELPAGAPGGPPASCVADKAFHVSPFNDRRGEYTFFLAWPGDTLDLRILLRRDGRVLMDARLAGQGRALNDRSLLRLMLRHPLLPLLTMPRILVQAVRLYGGRRLPFHPRPDTSDPLTIRQRGRWVA